MTKKNFAWPVTVMSYEDYYELKKCLDLNKDIYEKKIIIFGSGIRGTLFGVLLKRLGIESFQYCDNNEMKWGGEINGHEILNPEIIKNKEKEYRVLISTERSNEIERQLEKYGYRKNKHFFSIKSDIYDKYVDKFFEIKPIKFLILGDCGLSQISIFDSNYENLGEMMISKLGDNNVKVLAMHGMGMRAYYNILKIQLEMGMNPQTVLLMTNLEVFTGKHHILPRTQHLELFEKIKNKNLYGDNDLDDYILDLKKRINMIDSENEIWGKQENKMGNSEMILRMNYMYRIKKETEDINYLFEILKLCKKNSIKVIPFIPPVNYEYARSLIGLKFEERYKANVENVKIWIRNYGYEVLDLSFLLTSKLFAAKNTIDETANYDGRKKIMDEFSRIFY